MIPGKNY